jgi:hypothetical protein
MSGEIIKEKHISISSKNIRKKQYCVTLCGMFINLMCEGGILRVLIGLARKCQ